MVVLGGSARDAVESTSEGVHAEGGNAVSSEQEGGEPSLGEHEQATRSFLASHAQIVWSASADGTLHNAPLGRAYTGQGEGEARGLGWLEAVHADDRERVTSAWKHALAAQSACETEYRLRRSDV